MVDIDNSTVEAFADGNDIESAKACFSKLNESRPRRSKRFAGANTASSSKRTTASERYEVRAADEPRELE